VGQRQLSLPLYILFNRGLTQAIYSDSLFCLTIIKSSHTPISLVQIESREVQQHRTAAKADRILVWRRYYSITV